MADEFLCRRSRLFLPSKSALDEFQVWRNLKADFGSSRMLCLAQRLMNPAAHTLVVNNTKQSGTAGFFANHVDSECRDHFIEMGRYPDGEGGTKNCAWVVPYEHAFEDYKPSMMDPTDKNYGWKSRELDEGHEFGPGTEIIFNAGLDIANGVSCTRGGVSHAPQLCNGPTQGWDIVGFVVESGMWACNGMVILMNPETFEATGVERSFKTPKWGAITRRPADNGLQEAYRRYLSVAAQGSTHQAGSPFPVLLGGLSAAQFDSRAAEAKANAAPAPASVSGPASNPDMGEQEETSLMTSRHTAGFEEGLQVYKPLRDFMQGFSPSKTCSEYILQDCAQAFDGVRPGASAFFPRLVEESAKVTDSLLNATEPPVGDPACLFAMVCYTMDLRQYGAQKWQNFFDLINKTMQKRDPELLRLTEGYLHFFMKGINSIVPLPEKEFVRGLPFSARPIIEDNYRSGRSFHWSGLTSISEAHSVAKTFAGVGGVLIHCRCRTARSICSISAFPAEKEAILLPNFEGVVTQPLRLGEDGYLHLSVVEREKTTQFIY